MNKSTLYIIIAALLAVVIYFAWQNNNSQDLRMPPPGGAPGGVTLSTEEKAVCGITAEVTEGPYYVSGMGEAVNGNINFSNASGKPVTVSGYVYEGLDNTKPLKDAIVEVWHADTAGKYLPNGNGPKTNYKESELGLRAYVRTDDTGKYTFSTIYPGEYAGRTTHIHIKVRADGFKELTTQLILPAWDGSDDISFDDDTVSQGLPNCHLLKPVDVSGVATANFDFRLAK